MQKQCASKQTNIFYQVQLNTHLMEENLQKLLLLAWSSHWDKASDVLA